MTDDPLQVTGLRTESIDLTPVLALVQHYQPDKSKTLIVFFYPPPRFILVGIVYPTRGLIESGGRKELASLGIGIRIKVVLSMLN